MKFISVLFALFSASGCSVGHSDYRAPASASDPRLESILNPEQQGCCSWHGGVAGCVNHHVVCSDGMLSPSCGC